jgi:DNA-binding PadR family transcriptional regulator
VATVGSRPVVAGISGIVRGLLPDGYWVESGSTIGEIDPSAEPEYCYSLSDRALAVGSGTLAAILELWPKLSSGDELPVRVRGRRPRTNPGDQILGATEFALLGLLCDHPAHGYELSRAFGPDGDLQPVCTVGISQLYAYLGKLEALGLVTASEQAGAARPRAGGGRPARKTFSVSESGRRQFDQWLARPVPGAAYLRVDFMAKLYFARLQPQTLLLPLLREQIRLIRQELAELRAQRRDGGYRAEVAAAHEGLAQSGLDWLTTLESRTG